MVLWEIILIIPWSKGGGDEIISISFFFLRIHKSKVKIISLLYNVGDEFNITILVKEKRKKLKNS